MKLLKFFQYAYIIFAALFLWDAITNWSVDRNRAYMSLLFTALAIFMFFFRKRFRKKIEDRNQK
ncbi:hypothetical protein H8K90_02415 [Winogradskyella echinorum]|uniref:LPXTG-motif cell wall anchor domain-containing protein n=1 Tax=Winogradskyella echinorum TaxID=538189 RepID=A0ABR6XXL5_9FLAO|nr:hypothetical protein [Winogradskyella echinorum]MBC3845222.1 hypothetical protein [Winogradskyella echinorum]MBC5749570.1 hypothetical protein [Winogradskyella echinorum]